tara:strand:+ start:128 stop:370 length:243 start_codon:yes stop_codon:yes gene_type:complete
MISRIKFSIVVILKLFVLLISSGTYSAELDTGDIQNDVMDVTLFRGAANNTWFEVYFNAEPTAGSESVEKQNLAVDLRPE